MKAVGVILLALLPGAVAYEPCALQAEFDTVMCKSYVCMHCTGMNFCEEKCATFQRKYPKCRCPEWPCSRRCYIDSACPDDDLLPTCVDPTTTPPPTPAPEVVEAKEALEEEVKEAKEAKDDPATPEDEVLEEAKEVKEAEEALEDEVQEAKEEAKEEEKKKEIQEMPADMDQSGDPEEGGDDYDYGDGEGEWVDPFAGENDWETDKKQGDDSDGQLGLLRQQKRKKFLAAHPGWKAHHHGKKGKKGKKANFLMRFLRRHHLGKKLGLIFARGGQKNHQAPASKDHQEEA